jgi:opacity protein-like surface antigen
MNSLRKVCALVVTSAVAAVVGPALAQADGYRAPPRAATVTAPWNWSGLYFGGNAGYAWTTYENTYVAGGGFWELDSDTMTAGVQLGAQYQFGQIVLGIEGAISSAVSPRDNTAQCPNPATVCSGVLSDVVTVGPRIGYAMGKWMPYVTGGYANASFEHRVVSKATGLETRQAYDRTDGWYIGGGVDMAIAAGWSVGLEYRHYELGGFTSERNIVGGGIDPGDRANVETSLDTVSLRVNWKLGLPDAVVPLK